MALTTKEQELLNNATPGLARAGLGDKIAELYKGQQAATETTAGVVKQGEAVAEAAGAAPTAAEFKALLDSLVAAGVLAAAA